MRRLLASAHQTLQELRCESSLDEASRDSLGALLADHTWDTPEVLRPDTTAAAEPPGSTTEGGSMASYGRKAELRELPILAAALPAAVQQEAGTPQACPAGERWAFETASTAAAFDRMRERRTAAARRREHEQQRKDPAARLHEFQCRSRAPRCSNLASSGGGSSGSSRSRSMKTCSGSGACPGGSSASASDGVGGDSSGRVVLAVPVPGRLHGSAACSPVQLQLDCTACAYGSNRQHQCCPLRMPEQATAETRGR